MAALLSVLAVWLWLTGLQIHHSYAAATGCQPTNSLACTSLVSEFSRTYRSMAVPIAALLQVVPALIGAFAGAPVLARELETGTFRYVWTLGFGRWRWTLAKLVSLAVGVAAAAGVFSALLSWYFQPFFADGSQTPLAPMVFDLRGVAFAAWTLAAFAIGALAGMLICRVVPAITATFAAYAGLALAVGLYLQEHYAMPLLTSNNLNLPGSAWIISQWYTKNGQYAFGDRPPTASSSRSALPLRWGLLSRRRQQSRSALSSMATRCGPVTSPSASSGRSSGSRVAGCSHSPCF